MIITILDSNQNEVAVITVDDDTTPEQVEKIKALYAPRPKTMSDIVSEKIKHFRSLAPELLVAVYTQNTLSGMSTAQSDALFEYLADVILRVSEGAWPSALYRLNQKAPTADCPQEMIDRWKQMIVERL